jgi:16S rRNA (cytidine1402-2'-O)-methyltransferase
VEAVPGPAAGVAALSMSGFKGDVTFVGFLPRTQGPRLKMLAALAPEPRVLILYESPRRAGRTLAEIAEIMPGRRVLAVRELTKKFEETWRGPGAEVAAQIAGKEIKGEVTLVLSIPEKREAPAVDLSAYLLQCARETGLTGRRLADQAAGDLNLPRRQVYQAYLGLKEKNLLP